MTADKALETQFYEAMMATYRDAKRECKYNASYLLQMLGEYGGVETARRLLAKEGVSTGLWELSLCGRLDLAVEAKVLLPEFAPLFTPEERAKAQARLDQFKRK